MGSDESARGDVTLRVDGEWLRFRPEVLIVAGFTGRDPEVLRQHVAELELEGVPIPGGFPTFYVLPPRLLTQDDVIAVAHHETSGEAEIALFVDSNERYVTLASDHTDREAETSDIGAAKRVCPKPVAREAWRFDEVAAHWDQLELRSWIVDARGRRSYQEGAAGTLLEPDELLSQIPFSRPPTTYAILMGTVPVLGGIRASSRFLGELADPQRGRTIGLQYGTRVLDVLQA
jgi:hypothetical protein